ncbi:bifunctional cytochrome P450/NADPH--P450 reductase [Paenibacillus sp. GCM10028914]|uniref:bifunctional cytochrome P450/NADPH--P450 reductase n=1 Tax=Paenibacillus sp. GCM10028914 TaxID=3273416 RepID=UPI00360EF063
MTTNQEFQIPQPKTYGPLGNLPLLDMEKPIQSLTELSYELGPIFRMQFPKGRNDVYISSEELVADACDEDRFDKRVWAPLQKVRSFGGDGLFTSWTEEPNWQKAHNILIPSFSQRAMQSYHSMMVDIAVQLVQKWARLNPDESVNVPEDMTRLTLDTIGLCGFNYRFNSFYREQPHPFITSMVRALDEAMSQLSRLGIQDTLKVLTKRQFKQDVETMFSLVDKIISERKSGEDGEAEDLLSRMLSSKDPETGEGLDDVNIRYQIITFLIAGHETTSGLLSFAIYYLMNNPEVLQKAYKEVDQILTAPTPTYKQVLDLKYIRMILNESLRLWPTAPAFSVYAKEDTVLAGKFQLHKGESVNVLIPKLHRDKSAWGEDVDVFRPERFQDQSKVPVNAYKPFGNGQRACIGQQFALHEATLVLGMILKHFEFIDTHHYQLKVKETLTLKPDDFKIKVRVREQQPILNTLESSEQMDNPNQQNKDVVQGVSVTGGKHVPLLVLYGSNLGTAESIAREITDIAKLQGIQAEAASLNSRINNLPKEGAVVIVAASYNGKPASNAREFVQWLELLEQDELKGVKYAVFGCGDRTWASTYQAVPRMIDEILHSKGAKRISARGEGDASGDFEMQLDAWKNQFWADLIKEYDLTLNQAAEKERNSLTVKFVHGVAGAPLAQTYDAFRAAIIGHRDLQATESGRRTTHIEIALPEGVTYQEGDHLGVLPANSRLNVERVLRRFNLNGNELLVLSSSGRSAAHLPLGRPVSLYDLLSHSVEVQEAASRAQLRELAAYTVCPPHKRELEELLEEAAYTSQVLNKRVSMLDLLEKYEACEMPFERFMELLPPLKPRYYSISSSPLLSPDSASITVGVVHGTARSGKGEYYGVASNYLTNLQIGEEIVMFIRTPESSFRLPDKPETPIIMVGPGTGVAPFRGFLQSRSVMKQNGSNVGEAHLFYGCRNDMDYIYKSEMEQFEKDGLVKLHIACSRREGTPKTYVQHLIQEESALMIDILERQGGHLYICGDGRKMAPEVEETLQEAYKNMIGVDDKEAAKWLQQLQDEGRFAKDVWSGD